MRPPEHGKQAEKDVAAVEISPEKEGKTSSTAATKDGMQGGSAASKRVRGVRLIEECAL